jgi:hypothetical protein
MTTWTLRRIVILAVAVIVGAFVLKEGFASNGSESLAGASSPKPSIHSSPTPRSSPTPSRKPKVRGVVIQVVNGSGTVGLGAATRAILVTKGYRAKPPTTAPSEVATTTIYYRSDSKPEAEYLKTHYFPNAHVQPAPAGSAADVQLTVVLGKDFTGITT